MENGGKKIQKIKLYKCGYCENNLAHILKNVKKEKLQFPALAVLIQHQKYGNILFDTGYSEEIYKNGIISFIYNLLNKTYVTEEESIIRKLEKDNIKKIDKIILSHAHPDHIGGIKFFESYELVTTEEVWESMKRIKLRNLVFRNLVPDSNVFSLKIVEEENDKNKRLQSLENSEVQLSEKQALKKNELENIEKNFLKKYFKNVYDILGDGSIIGVKLNGHSDGQLGIYLPEFKMFFVADSTWGNRFLDKVDKMKKITQIIQKDYKQYCETAEQIRKLKKDYPEIKIIFSHEKFEEKIYE